MGIWKVLSSVVLSIVCRDLASYTIGDGLARIPTRMTSARVADACLSCKASVKNSGVQRAARVANACLSRRPLSKTVRFNVLRVIPAGSGNKKGFKGF
jgi:hypothetical protein